MSYNSKYKGVEVDAALDLAKSALQEHQDISGKVDKVSGKGLSTNDYTTDEKNKLGGIAAGAEVNVQSDWNVTDTTSDAYIKNKPTIPDAVTENTVSGWGFTKNTGTVTSIKINGSTKSPSSGVVDLGTVITSHQDISGKMDKIPVQNHGTSSTTLSIAPNVLHKWGTVSKLAITLTAPTDTSVYNEYMFQFTSGSTPTTLSLPSSVKWQTEPKVEANKTYQVSIVDNIGLIIGV